MPRRRLIILITLTVITATAGFLFWRKYKEWRAERVYIEAMTADTYGGKTPEETINLFKAALEKGDVELASKYFMFDNNLSKDKWLKTLMVFKNKGVLGEMAKDVNLNSLDIQPDKYSGVWKIVNFK